eukprot:614490-Rhodomonas_salina.2
MSSTRAQYIMSSTDILYSWANSAICFRAHYTVSGTDLAYGATRARASLLPFSQAGPGCPVLTYRMILPFLFVR